MLFISLFPSFFNIISSLSFSNAVAKPLLLYLEVIIFAPRFCEVLLFLLKLSFSPGRTGGFQLLRNKEITEPVLCRLRYFLSAKMRSGAVRVNCTAYLFACRLSDYSLSAPARLSMSSLRILVCSESVSEYLIVGIAERSIPIAGGIEISRNIAIAYFPSLAS